MICMNCGQEVNVENVCPHCGCDLNVQIKALKISNVYYNQGLDKARIRDLSGAIDLLTRSLKYNKRNIDARNLLGLCYFETGEVVSALSEWVLSKNMKPENNLASEYIEKVRANPARLETIQQAIRRYNRALDACRAGETDVAVLMLRKVVSANPKLIKAWYLLVLLYMKRGEYEKARRALRRAMPIDRTNATALRFLKEIDEQTGTVTDPDGLRKGIVREGRQGFLSKLLRRKNANRLPEAYMATTWDQEERIIGDPVVQPIAFHQVPAFLSLLNIVIGIILGALVVGFIAVPAVENGINRKAEERVSEYSSVIVTQNEHIADLEAKLEAAAGSTQSTNTESAKTDSSKADSTQESSTEETGTQSESVSETE